MTDAFTDDDAAQLDVAAMLAEGLAGDDGKVRGELRGEGALAAAIQFERAGVTEDDVALAVSQLHSETLGIEVRPAELPDALQSIVNAGRAASPRPHERALFLEWLALIPGLMRFRAS